MVYQSVRNEIGQGMMTCKKKLKLVLGLCAIFGYGDRVWSYEQPGVNLGFTSFLDGGVPAGPGFYFSQYLQLYSSNDFADRNGDNNRLFPTADPELTAWISLSQFIYLSDQDILFGGSWGLDVVVPYINLDVDFDSTGPISANRGGLGDIVIGPFLQWDPIMGDDGPLFVHRLELQFIVPSGKYSNRHSLNPGSNFFSFNPYWAATLFITPKLTASTRLHYLWNDRNNDPSLQAAPNSPFFGSDSVQAGQAIHLNFAVSYEVLPKQLRVGLNGYYLQQIGDTKVDGRNVGGSRERVLGLGPGMVYHFSQGTHLFVNTYFETAVKNRPSGSRYTLRLVHHF